VSLRVEVEAGRRNGQGHLKWVDPRHVPNRTRKREPLALDPQRPLDPVLAQVDQVAAQHAVVRL
jgi:hypothetical protein